MVAGEAGERAWRRGIVLRCTLLTVHCRYVPATISLTEFTALSELTKPSLLALGRRVDVASSFESHQPAVRTFSCIYGTNRKSQICQYEIFSDIIFYEQNIPMYSMSHLVDTTLRS